MARRGKKPSCPVKFRVWQTKKQHSEKHWRVNRSKKSLLSLGSSSKFPSVPEPRPSYRKKYTRSSLSLLSPSADGENRRPTDWLGKNTAAIPETQPLIFYTNTNYKGGGGGWGVQDALKKRKKEKEKKENVGCFCLFFSLFFKMHTTYTYTWEE